MRGQEDLPLRVPAEDLALGVRLVPFRERTRSAVGGVRDGVSQI